MNAELRQRLTRFSQALINQESARVIVEPQERASGFWFGGGNMIRTDDGVLHVVGRFRNAGDSRTGLASGTRGLELAIFRSADDGQSFQKAVSWDKSALNSPTGDVLSIEGSCLRATGQGVELYVSTEKAGVPYPAGLEEFLKPGAGVWTIDVLRASDIASLVRSDVRPVLASSLPEHLHVKDPFFWSTAQGDRLGFCSHPFGWSSSNTGVADLPTDQEPVTQIEHEVFRRGTTWDVAMTRGTCVLPVPSVGHFADADYRLLFYCGGECLRSLDEHATAVKRPRGYSCEEIGGVACFRNDNVSEAVRLSDHLPLFISPTGTGCSRYVDVLATEEGYYATWQQSQEDLSQPLVLNFLSRTDAEAILLGD